VRVRLTPLLLLTAYTLAACSLAPAAPPTPERIVVTVIVIVTATSPPAIATATLAPPTNTPIPVTATSRPTNTPPPPTQSTAPATITYPPAPTLGPSPPSTTPDPERNPDGCLNYQFANRHIGQQDCVSGTVVDTYASDKAFFINYSLDRMTFYGVSFDLRWENLTGRCVRLQGLIEEYKGRPQIVIRDASQLQFCD